MRVWTTCLMISLICISCRKDNLSCSKKQLAGTYYCAKNDQSIFIDFHTVYDNLMFTALPEIGYYQFNLGVELELSGCSFELPSFYENYSESGGPTYWMSGSGAGCFEPNQVRFDYNIKVTKTVSWLPESIVEIDSSFSNIYIKK